MPKYDEFDLDLQTTKVGNADNPDSTTPACIVSWSIRNKCFPTYTCGMCSELCPERPESVGCRSAQPY